MDRPYYIYDQNAVYFLTLTVVDWMDAFVRKEYKLEVVDSLNYCVRNKGLELYTWCLMSNHLHLLGRTKEPHKMSDFLRDFKKFVAKKILASLENETVESRRKWMLERMASRAVPLKRIEKYKFWEDGSHPVFVQSAHFLEQKLNYIHMNPVKAMIVEEPEHYIFSSAGDYAGRKGLVEVSVY